MTDWVRGGGVAALGALPFHPGAIDVVPPALSGLPQAGRGGLALEGPQAIGALRLAEVAPYGYERFTMRALEVEALPEQVDPGFVVQVVGVTPG